MCSNVLSKSIAEQAATDVCGAMYHVVSQMRWRMHSFQNYVNNVSDIQCNDARFNFRVGMVARGICDVVSPVGDVFAGCGYTKLALLDTPINLNNR